MAAILRLKDICKVWHIERTGEQVVALGYGEHCLWSGSKERAEGAARTAR